MRIIHTVEEGQAHGELRSIYQSVEATFGAPIVGALLRTMAIHPETLEVAWDQIRHNAETQIFVENASKLRGRADSIAEATFEFDDLYSWLQVRGFNREDLRRIRYALEMLHSLNPKMLLATAAMHVGLHNIQNPRIVRRAPAKRNNSEPDFPTKVARVMPDQAPSETMEIYLDAIDALGAPVIPDDLQMLAVWPQLLRRVWNELRPVMHSVTFVSEATRLSSLAIEVAQELPFPITIDDAGPDIRRMVDMYLGVYSRTLLATAAIRWMIVEGERINRVSGRAAGESRF